MDNLESVARANRVRAVSRAIVSKAFELCQPDNGDVFGWIDDHADELAEYVIAQKAAQ